MGREMIELHWSDSQSCAGWTPNGQHDANPALIKTVAWLIEETDEVYVVSSHDDPGNSHTHSPMTIPKCSVVDVWGFEGV
jgi:hypothetical protein